MIYSRSMASSPKPPPEERVVEIINTLPSSPNLVTETGSVILGTGLLATAISQELYVVNEETAITTSFFIFVHLRGVSRVALAPIFPRTT